MNREALINQLIMDEGLKLKPYSDTVGKLTIGVGRNLNDTGISEDEARVLLGNDIARTEQALDSAFPFWRTLSENRQEVIANMAFNMGTARLLDFKNMIHALQASDYLGAAREMLNSEWARQVKKRADRLADQMRNG